MSKETVIYVRSQNRDPSASLRRQEDDVRAKLASEGTDLTAFVLISDVASGARLDRPGLRRLLEMLDAGGVGVLASVNVTRLGRGRALMSVLERVQANGVRFMTVQDGEADWRRFALLRAIHDEFLCQHRAYRSRHSSHA